MRFLFRDVKRFNPWRKSKSGRIANVSFAVSVSGKEKKATLLRYPIKAFGTISHAGLQPKGRVRESRRRFSKIMLDK